MKQFVFDNDIALFKSHIDTITKNIDQQTTLLFEYFIKQKAGNKIQYTVLLE